MLSRKLDFARERRCDTALICYWRFLVLARENVKNLEFAYFLTSPSA